MAGVLCEYKRRSLYKGREGVYSRIMYAVVDGPWASDPYTAIGHGACRNLAGSYRGRASQSTKRERNAVTYSATRTNDRAAAAGGFISGLPESLQYYRKPYKKTHPCDRLLEVKTNSTQ